VGLKKTQKSDNRARTSKHNKLAVAGITSN